MAQEKEVRLIAGLIPALCGYEDRGLAIETHAVPMVSYPQDIKLVLCITDGACNQATPGKKICQSLRGRVGVTSILLDPDDHTKGYVIDREYPQSDPGHPITFLSLRAFIIIRALLFRYSLFKPAGDIVAGNAVFNSPNRLSTIRLMPARARA